MEMFRRIFFAAVLAGAVAGLVASAIQQWRIVPLILEAERYEISDAHAVDHEQDAAPAAPHAHEAQDTGGSGRIALTVLATVLTGLGFAFILGAVSALAGLEITSTNGLLWGLGGYFAFSLMPAIGLPPDLPGMVAADLAQRQVWWWGTVLATAAGIVLVAKWCNPAAIAVGIGLILLPHIIGAPQAPDMPSNVPAHLAAIYVTNSLGASMVFWLVLGAGYGWINRNMPGKKVNQHGG